MLWVLIVGSVGGGGEPGEGFVGLVVVVFVAPVLKDGFGEGGREWGWQAHPSQGRGTRHGYR